MHGQKKAGKPLTLCIGWLFAVFVWSQAAKSDPHSRYRRHVLPSDRVRVFSLDSNVSIAEHVLAVSHDSKVLLSEDFLNVSIWSSKQSTVEFDPNAVFVNVTAESTISHFVIGSSSLASRATGFTLSETTNRTVSRHSNFNLLLSGNVSLRFNTGDLTVEAGHGKKARISATTWKTMYPPHVLLTSNGTLGSPRNLEITSNCSTEVVNIVLEDCKVSLSYGHYLLVISADYRSVSLISSLYEIKMNTVMSSFDIDIGVSGLRLRSRDEKLQLEIKSNSSHAEVVVDQLSRLVLKENKGSLVKIAGALLDVNDMKLTSNTLRMEILSEAESHIRASTNRSRISIHSNLTSVQLTSAHHALDVLGGSPNFLLYTGNISLSLQAVKNASEMPTLLPPFQEPANKFVSIGPDYIDDLGNLATRVAETTPPATEVPTIFSTTEVSTEATTSETSIEAETTPVTVEDLSAKTDTTTSINVPTLSPTTDNFIIGQYGSNNDTFALSATISNITIDEAPTTPVTETDFPTPGSFPTAPIRRTRAAEMENASVAHVLICFENDGFHTNCSDFCTQRLARSLEDAITSAYLREGNATLNETIQVHIIDVKSYDLTNASSELRFSVVKPICFGDPAIIVRLLNILSPNELSDMIGLKVTSIDEVESTDDMDRIHFYAVLSVMGIVAAIVLLLAVIAPLFTKHRRTQHRVMSHFLSRREGRGQ